MAEVATPETGQTLERLQALQLHYEELADRRREAIVAALQAGNSLRAVAGAANCSYESVRRLAEPHAALFEWRGQSYLMTEHITRMLEYNAAGFARGAFASDVAELKAGKSWLRGAAELARQLKRVQRAEASEITLNKQTSFALFQILRVTMTARPSRLADLYDNLRGEYERRR